MYDQQFLLQLDQIQNRVLYTRIQIQNDYTGHYDGAYIEGKVTGGNVNLNGSSAMRRTASLQLIADQENYKITDVNNIISINKKVKIQIGIKNEIDQHYPEIVWFKLGTFVIANASINHSISGINISLSLKDLTALLDGSSGGTIPMEVVHNLNTVLQPNGSYIEEPIAFYTIIKSLLLEFTSIPEERIHIDIKGSNKSLVGDDQSTLNLKNTVRWTSNSPAYGVFVGTVPGTQVDIYNLTTTRPVATIINEYQYNDNIGYQYTLFTYPAGSRLISNPGESVASVLDKIKKTLGNFEYFFDIDGDFYFQEINNGILQGSSEINLTEAIGDKYLPNTIKDNAVKYIFDNSNLSVAYQNTPQYEMIKNDLVVWGVRGDGKLPLRYRLIIDKTPVIPAGKSYLGVVLVDVYGVKRVRKPQLGDTQIITIIPTDWRQYLYLDYVIDGHRNDYDKELEQELPKIMDVTTGQFYATIYKHTTFLNAMTYFIDILDPDKIEGNDAARIALSAITVSKIGRRTKSISDNSINTLFNPTYPDVIYIELNQENTSEHRQQAIQNQESFIQVPAYLAEHIALGTAINSAYDAIRSMLHEVISFNESISLQCLPIYYLDANQVIYVKDDDSGIDGNFIINSMSIPLAYNGNMSISARSLVNMI